MKTALTSYIRFAAILAALALAAAFAGTASASTSLPTFSYTYYAGNCYFTSFSTLAIYSPGITVFGIGPSADSVQVWSRIVTTDGSVVSNWGSGGLARASSSAPVVYNPVGWTIPMTFPVRNLRIQIAVQWYQNGSLYLTRTADPLSYYTAHAGSANGVVTYCQA